jgi:hypothetical protein
MLGVMLLQLLLLTKVIPFEQEVGPVVFATGLVGVWLILVSYLGRRQRSLPPRLAWLGMAVGAAFVLKPILLSAAGGGLTGGFHVKLSASGRSAVVFGRMWVSDLGHLARRVWLTTNVTDGAAAAQPHSRSRCRLTGGCRIGFAF